MTALNERWYVMPNYLIGGWWIVTDRLDPETSSVLDMIISEEIADHVVELHNEWLVESTEVEEP